MAKAILIKSALPGFSGHANLYRCDPPMAGNSWDDESAAEYPFVVVSAANVPFSGPETYIFGSDENGEIADWGELSGSYRGGLDHDEALSRAGYEAVATNGDPA